MFGFLVAITAAVSLMGVLFLIAAAWTVIVKITHPDWSWKKCAQYTTLI